MMIETKLTHAEEASKEQEKKKQEYNHLVDLDPFDGITQSYALKNIP